MSHPGPIHDERHPSAYSDAPDPSRVDTCSSSSAMSTTKADSRPPVSLRFAQLLSDVFTPPWVMLATQAAITVHAAGMHWRSVGWIAVAAITMTIVPYVNVLVKVRRGRLSDRHLRQRQQRTSPVLFGLASCAVGLGVLLLSSAPAASSAFMVATIVNFLALLLVTRFFHWKISLHAGVIASSAVLLGAIFGPVTTACTLAVTVATCWGRVHMRDHTPAQVLAGSLLGSVVVCAAFTLTSSLLS